MIKKMIKTKDIYTPIKNTNKNKKMNEFNYMIGKILK